MHGPLPLAASTSLEESYRLIDEAISRHQSSIMELKHQKNGLAPISRLPAEIFCKIFLQTKALHELDDARGNRSRVSLRWIAEVSHICSYWRNVAINFPRLWIELPIDSLHWVKEMLQRSKDAALIVKADLQSYFSQNYAEGLKLALRNSTRIKHLIVLNIRDLPVWNAVQRSIAKSAPQLEWLHVTRGYAPKWNIRIDNFEPNPAEISEDVLCEAGRLRHLVLEMCRPNWTSHPSFLRSLTHLRLCEINHDFRPTIKQFLDGLAAMPDLQFLDLQHAIPSEQIPWPSEQVHLASIRTLFLQSTHTELKSFFGCVTFPPTANVRVACIIRENFPSEVNLSGVIPAITRSYSNAPSDVTFHTMIFPRKSITTYRVHLQLFTDYLTEEEILSLVDEDDSDQGGKKSFVHAHSAKFELLFAWAFTPANQYIQNFMVNDVFGGAMNLQDIARVYLGTDEGVTFTPETIANTFGKLPQVQSIITNRSSTNVFLHALEHHSYDAGLIGEPEKIYFPSLSSITFLGTKFWNPHPSVDMQDSKSISHKSLKTCLSERALDHGAKIQNLKLKSCHRLSRSDVDVLKEVVPCVEWDEIEDFGISESEHNYGWEDDDDDEEEEEEDGYYDYDDEIYSDGFYDGDGDPYPYF
ncbi:hypothetical protein BDN70DRAFT_830979 [Pholiota conissans]|uniref:F-box domain-containing protein n=1 Tax=Pholiota conissans TaxID=109636 RepID=A0A9P6CV96_9AGAR|nr:hypothetical protein BDN70DRAFT_830979 [Pholiota conissans]